MCDPGEEGVAVGSNTMPGLRGDVAYLWKPSPNGYPTLPQNKVVDRLGKARECKR